ncbi:MAG: DNA primase [Alphaproteobacteria bacterium]
MSIHQRFLDDIRARLILSEVIGQRIPVTRAGREHKACCPFHKEKTPSFTINDDKQFYHCFGCGAHGDVINFVMQHDNLPFPETVELLAAQAGLQVPQSSPQDRQKAKEEKDLYSLMGETAQWFSERLFDPAHKDVLGYVRERGLREDTINGFRLGFAPNDHQALRTHLKGRGYSDSQMIAVGVVKKGKDGKEPYVFFRERVMVPVLDRRGRVVAFGGRILPDHMRRPDHGSSFVPAKYMNSSETPIFNKSNILYGAPQARQAAGDGQVLFVVEGYFDVIACHQAGFRGAVAPMGTALTEEQMILLWKMGVNPDMAPILCFDGDAAGRRAAERAAERVLPLLSAGKTVRFAFLPDGEDPDSLIKGAGKAAFAKVLNGAIPMIEFLWQMHVAGRNFETPESRAALMKTLNDAVARIQDREVQRHYDYLLRQKISAAFFTAPNRGRGQQGRGGADRSGTRSALGRNNSSFGTGYGGGGAQKSKTGAMLGAPLRSPRGRSKDVQIRILIAALFNHNGLFEEVEEQFARLLIDNEELDRLRRIMLDYFHTQEELDLEGLSHHINYHGYERLLYQILSPATYTHGKFSGPFEIELFDVKQKWLALFETMETAGLNHEIKAGWKRAFEDSSEDEENKVRQILIEQSSQ